MPRPRKQESPPSEGFLHCAACLRVLPVSHFDRTTNRTTYRRDRHTHCFDCRRSYRIHRSATLRGFLANLLAQTRYRAKRAFVSCSITLPDLLSLWHSQNGLCALSHCPMTHVPDEAAGMFSTNVSIDRIRPDLPYSPSNIRLVCSVVNRMRGVVPDPSFIHWCALIASAHQPAQVRP